MADQKVPAFLLDRKVRVEKELDKIIKKEFSRLKRKWQYMADLFPEMEKYLKRSGKRIRPILTIASYEGFGGTGNEIMLPAIGSEFIHASFLANDDLYDEMPGQKQTRGGEKVIQDSYQVKFSSRNPGDSNWEPKLFSKHAATAAVNLFLIIGGNLILKSDFEPELKEKAMNVYWETLEDEWSGQSMDVLSKGKSISEVSEKEINSIELARSASYSTRFPLVLGATLAKASDEDLRILSLYGFKVGLAFQIYDDVMGIFGNVEDTGKTQAELAEGKRTLLIQKTLELGTVKQKKGLIKLMRSHTQTAGEIKQGRKIIRESGALDVSLQIADELINEGISKVENLNSTPLFKSQLLEFARFVTHRHK